jgi:hypothetical protein
MKTNQNSKNINIEKSLIDFYIDLKREEKVLI